MGIHRAFSRPLFTLNGNVLTSGGAKNLAKGQFTVVNSQKAGADGAIVVNNFNGLGKDAVLEMRVGTHKVGAVRTNNTPSTMASETFRLKDVVGVKATYPKFFEQTFDDLIVGWDGINAGSEIDLEEGQTTLLDVTVSGDHVGFITGNTEYTFTIHFGREVGETNQEMVERAVEILKKQIFPQGNSINEVIDIKVVDSEHAALAGTSYTFSHLTLTDEGDSNALALVQAQYPSYTVQRTSRNGLSSVYTILAPTSASIAAYTTTLAKTFKSCEDCPAGYTAVENGVIYSISIEDDGADLTTTIDNVPGFVTGTVVRKGQDATNGGRGVYTVITDNALTQTEIDAYVATAGVQTTAQITLIGEVADVCYNSTVTSTAWVAGDACAASVESYTIQLKDDDCDGSRLAELQAAYPGLVIEAGAATGSATQAVTLAAGATTGNLVITVDGTAYTTANSGTAAATATAFVAAHAAAILADTGAVITNPSTGVVLFTDDAEGFPSIIVSASTLTTLANTTVGALDYLVTSTTGGCQAVYSTTVVTDVVCDECDPIFVQNFSSEAPADFDFHSWVKVEEDGNEDALMGIRLTGKPFIMTPTEYTRDSVPFYETSTGISVAGGYIEEVNNSFDPQYSDIFKVTRLSRKQDRDGLGYSLLQWEDASRYYFTGTTRHEDNLFAKGALGEESVLKYTSQYAIYHIEIQDSKASQSAGRHSDMATDYMIFAEFGRHTAIEDYINKLAVAAGHNPVQISAE